MPQVQATVSRFKSSSSALSFLSKLFQTVNSGASIEGNMPAGQGRSSQSTSRQQGSENKMPAYRRLSNPAPQAVSRRLPYTVGADESLQQIAFKKFGDQRYARLLLTINRSEIKFLDYRGVLTPSLVHGQVIWLPTHDEVRIHAQHYFTGSDMRRFSLFQRSGSAYRTELNRGVGLFPAA